MSFSDVHPGDPMNAVNVQQVIDALKGTAGKGVPLVVDAVNDSTRYALTLQNDDAVNSRAINVLKSDGTVMIAADATGVTLGSPLNLQPNSVPGAAIANASITNAKLGPDVARANLLTNGSFEIWQRGNGPFAGGYSADRWAGNLTSGDTMSISRESGAANIDVGSQYCAAVTYTRSTGGSVFSQVLSDQSVNLRGRTISFSGRVKCSTPNAVRLRIYDGTANYSAYHSGSGTYETLSLTRPLAISVSTLFVDFIFDASCTAYVDNAMLVVGSQPADYVPLHPADDLARCLRYYELLGVPNGGDVGVSGYAAGAGAAVRQFYQYRVIKAAAATVTRTGNFGLTNMQGQPIAAQVQQTGFLFYGTATAAGDCWAYNNSGNLVVESNP